MGLPSRLVWEVVGIAPSTLNYWVQLGLVRPTIRQPQGRRVEQWWSVEDVVVVRAIKALRAVGVSMKQVRKVRRVLLAADMTLASSRLYWDGTDVVLLDSGGNLESALQRPGQQMMVLAGLPIAEWHKQYAEEARPVDSQELQRMDRVLSRARSQRSEPIERLITG